jgi:PAS domain S-box-containing protein
MKDESDPRNQPGHNPQKSAAPWFKALVEQSPLGISVARDGITLYTNQACARLFGYDSPEKLVGTSQLGRVAPESRAQVNEYIQRRKRGEPAPLAYEIRGLRRDGSTFTLYVEVVRIEWHDGPVSMAYFTDFTEKKRAEEALRESEKRFRSLVESIDEFLAENDTNGVCTYASLRLFDILGYQPDELLGKTPFDFMVHDEAERVRELFRRAVSQREPLHSLVYTILHKSGRPLIMETSAIPYFDEKGALAGYRSITRDVTARKEMEDALRKAYDDLEARVRERTEELASVNAKLLKDITERLRVEETLRRRELELEARNIKLEDMNVTLRTILEQREQDRRILEQQVIANFNDLIKPLLDKLRKALTETQRASCLDVIESCLDDIVSPFTRQLTGGSVRLTATEIQIANCVRQGMRSKEISDLLKLSKGTVDFHRNNIRRKLGIGDRKTNLRAYLLSGR